MALEYDTQKLYEFYQSNPEVKKRIDRLPQDRWIPELQKEYNKRGSTSGFDIAAAAMVALGLLYLL